MAPLASLPYIQSPEPISRTMQYRKVTKPLLERQRRARINRCLDELKDILVSGLSTEGESVARLEKADILELTVRHLQKLTFLNTTSVAREEEKFRVGFSSCAQEVSKVLATTVIDVKIGSSLMAHLAHSLNSMTKRSRRSSSSSISSTASDNYRPYTPPASPAHSDSSYTSQSSSVWRPW